MLSDTLLKIAAYAVAVFAACSTAGAASNLVRHGSFEKPEAGNGGFLVFSKGERIGPWRIVGEDGELGLINENFVAGGFTAAPKFGKQWLDLTPRSSITPTAIGVQQNVSTTPGEEYVLTFYVGNVRNPGGPYGVTSTVNVFVDGSQVLSATNKAGKGKTSVVWRKFSVGLTATRATTRIAFINGDNDDLNGLDGVSLVVAP